MVRDIENTYLQLETSDESALNDLLSHSITYRIAVGPQAGRKAFTLQTVPAREQENDNPNLAKTAGFSLHAGVTAKAHQRRKLERLCRYIARPAVATNRLALTPQGHVRYTLKTPYRQRPASGQTKRTLPLIRRHREPGSTLLAPTNSLLSAPFERRVCGLSLLSVRVAENGEQGVEQFKNWRPHFIWMDRSMPVMDGMAATKAIRQLPCGQDVKIVAVTASAFSDERQAILDGGMDDYLSKPYRAADVYDCMAKQLGVTYVYEAEPRSVATPR